MILAGSASIVVAGGMVSMSNAPYLLAKARNGYRVGHDRVLDHMLLDGLEDAYEHGRSMGDLGEATAEAYQLTAGTVSIASATTPDRQSVRSNDKLLQLHGRGRVPPPLMSSRCRSLVGVRYLVESEHNGVVSRLRIFSQISDWSTSSVFYELDEMVQSEQELHLLEESKQGPTSGNVKRIERSRLA